MSPTSTKPSLNGCGSILNQSIPQKKINKTTTKLPSMMGWRVTTLTVWEILSPSILGNSKPSKVQSPGPAKSDLNFWSESLSVWIVARLANKYLSSLNTHNQKSVWKIIVTRPFGSLTSKGQYLQTSRKLGYNKTQPKSQQEPCHDQLTWCYETTTQKEASQETFYASLGTYACPQTYHRC